MKHILILLSSVRLATSALVQHSIARLRNTVCLPLLSLLLFSSVVPTFGQGTAFTYQGRLNSNSVPAHGDFELMFLVFSNNLGGVAIADAVIKNPVAVSNGLFVVSLDFGTNAFTGGARWLQIAVGNGAGSYVTLVPRQPLTPTPYAIQAANAGMANFATTATTAGSVAAANITGTISLAQLPAGVVTNGASSAGFWKTNGNAGTSGAFLGTTDNLPLEIKVNGQRALRFEPNLNSPNIIGGYSGNIISNGVVGGFIGGGGVAGYLNRVGGHFASVSGGYGNTSSGPGTTVGGGMENTSSGTLTTVGGGQVNTSSGISTTVGGGYGNISSGNHTTVGGGLQNSASVVESTVAGGRANAAAAIGATVSGGYANTASGNYATVPGGMFNSAANAFAFAAGFRAKADHPGDFVWADSTDADFASTASDQFLIRASGGVGIGTTTPGSSLEVAGGIRARGGAPGALGLNNNGYAFSGNGGDNDGGMFSSADGQLEFYGNSQERMRITSTGTVGIGINNPAANLHVNGTTIVQGNNNWGVSGGEGDFRVGNDSFRFKIGVANDGGGAGDIWMRAHGGIQRINIKAPGGTRILSNEAETSGVSLPAGGTSWAVISDRNVKKDFADVNCVDVLEKLVAMPISQWRYNWESEETTPHIGPMAQDFKAAFYPGTDDKSITTQEADGVALAAIQGLNEKLEARSQKLETDNAELKTRLEKLEKLLQHKLDGVAQ
jgi:hypothetical protein